MTKKERYQYILDYFREHQPVVTTELEFGSAFQLLCATLLSAQCTDKRINQVTPALFARYPDAHSMAQAEPEDVLEYVSSVSYPNSKAKHLVEMSRMLVSDFGARCPATWISSSACLGWGARRPMSCRPCGLAVQPWLSTPTCSV